jgi:hypothetical protein
MPQRRENHKKRARESTTMAAALANTLRSLFGGRKPWRREARCKGTRIAREGAKNLLNWLQIGGIASQLHNRTRRTLQCKKMPERIKPVEPGYVVSAHVDDIHSLFRGRIPQRREDQSKRARRLGSKDAARKDALHSPLEGRKPQRRVDTSRE